MKKFIGKVISTKMNKTATIEVVNFKIHPIYKKRLKIKKKFHAHDDLGVKVNDKVVIVETRPISRTKKWKIIEVVKK